MSYRQFWYGDAETYWAYRTAFLRNLEFKKELDNFNSWLLGAYIHDSTSKVIYNAFGRDKNAPMEMYVDRPYDFGKQEREKVEEDKKAKAQLALENQMKAYIAVQQSKLIKAKVKKDKG